MIANARRHRDERRARGNLETLIDTSPISVVVFDARTAAPVCDGCRQPSNQAHKTISWRGELAAPGSGDGFHHVCTPFKLLRARTSPLVASLHL